MNHDSWRTKLDKIGILLILDIDLLTGMGWKVSDRLVRFRRAWKLQIEKHQMKSWTCNCNWVSYSPEMWHDACFQMMLRCNDTRINWLIFRKLQQCWHGNHWTYQNWLLEYIDHQTTFLCQPDVKPQALYISRHTLVEPARGDRCFPPAWRECWRPGNLANQVFLVTKMKFWDAKTKILQRLLFVKNNRTIFREPPV